MSGSSLENFDASKIKSGPKWLVELAKNAKNKPKNAVHRNHVGPSRTPRDHDTYTRFWNIDKYRLCELLAIEVDHAGKFQCRTGHHKDEGPSVQVYENGFKCFGCGEFWTSIDLVMDILNLNFPEACDWISEKFHVEPLKRENRPVKHQNATPVATYRYNCAAPFEVVYYQNGTVRFRTTGDNGKWLAKRPATFYHEPELVREPSVVRICPDEASADAMRSLGVSATTVPGGVCHASGDERLPGNRDDERQVYIFTTSDIPTDKTSALGLGVYLTNKKLKVVDITDILSGNSLKSLIDSTGADHVKQLLKHACETTPEYEPPPLATKTGRQIEIISVCDMMALEIPEPEFTIQDLICEGNLAVLAGKPKIGKSLIALSFCVTVASGGLALDRFKCKPGPVLYLALEDPIRRLQTRIHRLLRGARPPEQGFIVRDWPALPEGQVLIERWLDKNKGARMIIIDTLQRLRAPNSKNTDAYSLDYHELGSLQKLAIDRNVSIIVIHHQRKSGAGESGDIYDTILGSTAITGTADTILIFEKKRAANNGTLFVSGRDIEEKKHALEFDHESLVWRWVGEASDVKRSSETEEVRSIMRQSGLRPMNAAEIAELTNPRVSKNAIEKRLSRMVDRGEIEKAAGQKGRYVLPPEDFNFGGFGHQSINDIPF